MFQLKTILPLLLAGLLSGCNGETCTTLDNSEGTQSDYSDAYDACYSDGQDDVCAGSELGVSYDNTPYDVCDDGLSDQGTWGCEDGYSDGYNAGCEG